MESITSIASRNCRLALSAAAVLGLGNVAWGVPSIQSIAVSPDPLVTGQLFTIAVNASPDVTEAAATVNFRTGLPQSLEIPLARQGQLWTGSGFVPTNILLQLPGQAGAMVRVLVFDAAHRRIESVAQVGLQISRVSAAFVEGVLTITGDDDDNTLIASRDAAGTILVNGTGTNDVITVTGSTNGVTVLGLGAAVTVIGGEGNDLLVGGRDADTMAGGPGDDTFVWNPGDGSDVLEGQVGNDSMVFNGANVAESVDLSANGQRVRFSRNVAGITMDCNEVELMQFNALGDADLITINDLSGTGVTTVNLNLKSPPDSNLPDNQPDTIVVNGTSGDDAVTVVGSATGVSVHGLSAAVNIIGSEPDLDKLIIRLLAGNDVGSAADLPAGSIGLTIDGGIGDDVLVGSAGADVLIGDEGDDVLTGGLGLDLLDGGPGNNVVIQD